jgi:hypothetical protein
MVVARKPFLVKIILAASFIFSSVDISVLGGIVGVYVVKLIIA